MCAFPGRWIIEAKPHHLGNALSAERKTGEAISHYKTVIKLRPDFAEARHNLKMALLRADKMEEWGNKKYDNDDSKKYWDINKKNRPNVLRHPEVNQLS